MAYYKFTDAIANDRPIEIFNEGTMERDFTYIDDIVKGTAAAIDLNAGHEVFNLGNEYPEQLITMIEILEELLGKKAIKHLLPMQQGDVTRTCSDGVKAKKILNFSPKIDLKEGLSRFVSWYKNDKARQF